MAQPEIDAAVLRDGVGELRELFAAQGHPLARATQAGLEQEVINWVKVHPEDVHLSVHAFGLGLQGCVVSFVVSLVHHSRVGSCEAADAPEVPPGHCLFSL